MKTKDRNDDFWNLPLEFQGLELPKEPANEPQGRHAAGLVLLTHGFDIGFGQEPRWLRSLQDAIACRLNSGGSRGRLEIVKDQNDLKIMPSWQGNVPCSPHDAEAFLWVDWTQLANHLVSRISTDMLAQALARHLLDSKSHLPPLSQIPLHLIGHSRGASLFCRLCQLLDERSIQVDHLTLLDPHPLTIEDPQPPGQDPVLDASMELPGNVRFCDCYYQTRAYPRGEPVKGAYNRVFTALPGGYHRSLHTGFASHQNLVLLYQATVQTQGSVANGEATMHESLRPTWFEASEGMGSETGYYFSRAVCPERRPV